jgi:hypothetical protein
MTRARGKVVECGLEQARIRLRQAQAFVWVAGLVLADTDNPDLPLGGVTAAVAVLSGIAAADAACCARLGKQYRGQDHTQAVDLVRTVRPQGELLAKDLGRLLAIKDNVHYQAIAISATDAKAAVAQARRMVDTVAKLLA